MHADLATVREALRVAYRRGDLTPRFLLTAGAAALAWSALYLLVRTSQALDRWITPQVAEASIPAPIFIVANPRSGTTFLHRLMSRDPQFSSLQLYETLLPSTVLMRAVRLLGRMDRRVGHPLGRLVRRGEELLFGGWRGIHRVSFTQPEEDEMLFVYALRSPALLMVHPAFLDVPGVREPDALPPRDRDQLEADLAGVLQRHAWASEGGRLLAKNALAAGRLGLYRAVAPDLRVVLLIRHPYEAIPSMVSMFSRPWRLFNPAWARDPRALAEIAQLGCDYYRALDRFAEQLPPEQLIEVAYEDLVSDPKGTVCRIYEHFGLELTPAFAAELDAAAARAASYSSPHRYDLGAMGLSREWIHERLTDVFARRGFAT